MDLVGELALIGKVDLLWGIPLGNEIPEVVALDFEVGHCPEVPPVDDCIEHALDIESDLVGGRSPENHLGDELPDKVPLDLGEAAALYPETGLAALADEADYQILIDNDVEGHLAGGAALELEAFLETLLLAVIHFGGTRGLVASLHQTGIDSYDHDHDSCLALEQLLFGDPVPRALVDRVESALLALAHPDLALHALLLRALPAVFQVHVLLLEARLVLVLVHTAAVVVVDTNGDIVPVLDSFCNPDILLVDDILDVLGIRNAEKIRVVSIHHVGNKDHAVDNRHTVADDIHLAVDKHRDPHIVVDQYTVECHIHDL